ncbi:MAG: hypothetical protein HZB31_03100 [Nitrospirae bacterium]|nr:hypothetical protein [Nitrospirota bacterium]
MESIYLFFQNNIEIVYFLYGLSFVVMGILILAHPKKGSEFAFSGILWLLVAYAFTHAPADFIDMWVTSWGYPLHIPQAILTFVSYLFLFEFGRRLLVLAGIMLPGLLLPAIVASIVIGSLLSSRPWEMLQVLTGYFLRFPAGLMAGVGLLQYYRSQKVRLEGMHIKPYFLLAGVTFFVWAVFCGIIRTEGDFFPADRINTNSFLNAVGVPVHMFRMVCALIIAWALAGILRILDWEMNERQQRLILELQDAHTNEKKLQGILPICSFCSKVRDDKGQWNHIEQYITQHSNAKFTHGYCPVCAQKHYPEFLRKARAVVRELD